MFKFIKEVLKRSLDPPSMSDINTIFTKQLARVRIFRSREFSTRDRFVESELLQRDDSDSNQYLPVRKDRGP
jgi:hypothetical protein